MEHFSGPKALINNEFYEDLQENWYTAFDHPIALLRAENAVRTPWIISEIEKRFATPAKVLDVGCGGGFLTNALAERGHITTGIDLSETSLEVAKKHDSTGKVRYLYANGYNLPFENESFDAVCAMDILEHVEAPEKIIAEASRVLRPGGLFFFHTFNRNWLSYMVVIKGVDLFVKNAPKNMHVYELFIKPSELKEMCFEHNLKVENMVGLTPQIGVAFWKMLFTRSVPEDFRFAFSKSLTTGYCGFALKV
jgi:2-polyprenyl-6-hydroxyphenyl methylase/3-demethylubiquinone-9 3-methyltransferase